MKILHAFTNYLNISENWAYRLISNIPEVENIIVSSTYQKNNFYNTDFKFLDFPIQYFEGSSLQKRLANKLISVVRRNFIPSVIRSLRASPPEIIHSHYGYTGWNFRKIATYFDIPHVVSFYGWDYEKFVELNPGWDQKYRELFRIADKFICEGPFAGNLMVKMGCPEHKVEVVKLGIGVNQVPFKKRSRNNEFLHLVQIANFTEKKGQIFTLKAFALASRQIANLRLTFIGGGSNDIKNELLEVVRLEGLQDRVTFIDHVDFAKLHDELLEYDVFIHPSCYSSSRDSEGGAPVVLMDAQASGMPIISTRHCDIPNIVEEGVTGLLSDEKDVDGIAASILSMATMNKEGFTEMSFAARKYAEEHFDIKKSGAMLRGVYDQVC